MYENIHISIVAAEKPCSKKKHEQREANPKYDGYKNGALKWECGRWAAKLLRNSHNFTLSQGLILYVNSRLMWKWRIGRREGQNGFIVLRRYQLHFEWKQCNQRMKTDR